MRETPDDLARLQDLLDRSFDERGTHMRRILTPERRLTAEEVGERLTGVCLLALATATADGRPIVGPVDGVFMRGCFHFSSAPDSVRARHIAARPHVSATHAPREELAVTVHGRAVRVDIGAPEGAELRATLLDVYGADHEAFLDSGPANWRIEPERMFIFCSDPAAS